MLYLSVVTVLDMWRRSCCSRVCLHDVIAVTTLKVWTNGCVVQGGVNCQFISLFKTYITGFSDKMTSFFGGYAAIKWIIIPALSYCIYYLQQKLCLGRLLSMDVKYGVLHRWQEFDIIFCLLLLVCSFILLSHYSNKIACHLF